MNEEARMLYLSAEEMQAHQLARLRETVERTPAPHPSSRNGWRRPV